MGDMRRPPRNRGRARPLVLLVAASSLPAARLPVPCGSREVPGRAAPVDLVHPPSGGPAGQGRATDRRRSRQGECGAASRREHGRPAHPTRAARPDGDRGAVVHDRRRLPCRDQRRRHRLPHQRTGTTVVALRAGPPERALAVRRSRDAMPSSADQALSADPCPESSDLERHAGTMADHRIAIAGGGIHADDGTVDRLAEDPDASVRIQPVLCATKRASLSSITAVATWLWAHAATAASPR